MIPLPKGFILAAGLGTRLRPLTHRLAKPVFPFFGAPIASHALTALYDAGVKDIVINLHHLGESVVEYLSPRIPSGVEVFWSEERSEILGTGGAVVPWLDLLGFDHFFLVNGDTYRSFLPSEMFAFHLEKGGAATVSLYPAPEGTEAPVEVDEEGRVVRFLNAKRPGAGRGKPMLFTGMHVFAPAAVPFFKAVEKSSFCVNREVHTAIVASGGDLFGFSPEGGYFWSDLGTPESYLSAHFSLLQSGKIPSESAGRLVLWDEVTPEGGAVIAPSWLGDGAVVEKGACAGPFAVLGMDARVSGGARVARSVVWDGVTVSENIENTVEAGFNRIIAGSGGVA